MPDTSQKDLVPQRRRAFAPRPAGDLFDRMRADIDELFGSYLRPWAPGALGAEGDFDATLHAKLDVSETKDALVVALDAPGFEEGDIDITLSEGLLTIAGQRQAQTEEEDKQFHRVERQFGSFSRTIALPCEVNADKVGATLKSGVLTVRLPKSDKAKERERKIPIKGG